MEKLITYDNLRLFGYSNDKLITGKIKGIVVEFFGLGGSKMIDDDTADGKEFAKENIIFLVPYYNPWSWMNKQAIDLTDELLDVLIDHYKLNDVKIISTGGSMGGLSSLVFVRYSSHKPAGCVANCPVCDLPYHYTERKDLPRTLYSAFGNEKGSLQEVLEKYSPLHLVDTMPKIKYTIFHCCEDKAVNMEKHSIAFIKKMKKDHDITFYEIPLRGHCDLSPQARMEYRNTILKYISE